MARAWGCWATFVFLASLIGSVLVIGCAADRAQADAIMPKLFPQALTAPAPPWLQSGLRMTYYGGAAIIPEDRHFFWRDSNGGWVDQDGNRYRRDKVEGHGGVGYTQVNVAWAGPRLVVLDTRVHNMVRLGGPSQEVGGSFTLAAPGIGGDWWISPQVLSQVAQVRKQGMVIMRMPYMVDGRTYRAIRFQLESKAAQGVYVYDLDSGVLLHSSVATRKDVSFGHTTQGFHAGQRGRMFAHATFKGMRRLKIPWHNQMPPSWVANIRQIDYRGEHTVKVPGAGSKPIRQPGTAQVVIVKRGPQWLLYGLKMAFHGLRGMPPATFNSQHACGPANLGGLWIPPAAMANLRQGQVLDRDPFTQVTTKVVRSNKGVLIVQENPVERTSYGYHLQSGMLVYYAKHIFPQYRRFELRYQGRQ